jgi:oleandomycin transport system ATP-binding protein
VTSIVHDLTGAVPEVDGTTVTASVTDPAVLPALVRRLDDADVVVAGLALRDASLDEVFLSLTGHRADETDTSDLERTPA